MRAAGIRSIGDTAAPIDLPEPRALRADEVLLDVRACGVGNWDEFVRTGGWDTGARPPMAMGVEAAGLVAAVGDSVGGLRPGDPVTTHSLPLRERMRGHPVARPDPVYLVPDRGDDPGRLDPQRHRRAGAHVPASGAGDLIPVAHPAGPDVDQHLVRPQRPRSGQFEELDRSAELAYPRCFHGSLLPCGQ